MKGIKKILALSLLTIFSFSMISCGNSNTEKKQLEDTVVVTTKYPDEVMKYVSDEFKKETGINVEYEVKDEISEDDFKNPKTDIVLGGDKELYKKETSNGNLTAYKTSWFDDVDENYRDKEGYWYSVFRNPIVVVYNKANLQGGLIPTKLQDLELGKLTNKIVMVNANNFYTKYFISASGLYLTAASNNDENVANLFLKSLKMNVANFYNNYSDLATALSTKETPIGIMPFDVFMKKSKVDTNLNRIDLPDGSPVVNECAGILKTAPHSQASELFMEYIAGPKVQLELAQKYNIMPILPVAKKYEPDWMKNFKTMDVKEDVVLSNESKWVQYFNGVIKPESLIPKPKEEPKKTS
ncbi:extracellular solute-binding protein [Clostridium sp. B9]|uniref:extracellular solute-binding protein n=1 Tax=Clostridium sp. B9 TaxID=3423224 RepID=UPI003D2F2079